MARRVAVRKKRPWREKNTKQKKKFLDRPMGKDGEYNKRKQGLGKGDINRLYRRKMGGWKKPYEKAAQMWTMAEREVEPENPGSSRATIRNVHVSAVGS